MDTCCSSRPAKNCFSARPSQSARMCVSLWILPCSLSCDQVGGSQASSVWLETDLTVLKGHFQWQEAKGAGWDGCASQHWAAEGSIRPSPRTSTRLEVFGPNRKGTFKKELLRFTAIKCLFSTHDCSCCAVQGWGSHFVASNLLGSQTCVPSHLSTAKPLQGASGNSGVWPLFRCCKNLWIIAGGRKFFSDHRLMMSNQVHSINSELVRRSKDCPLCPIACSVARHCGTEPRSPSLEPPDLLKKHPRSKIQIKRAKLEQARRRICDWGYKTRWCRGWGRWTELVGVPEAKSL